MYGCKSQTIKKAECQRTDAFELRCWRRLLRVPWTAKRSNQSILKEIIPEYSLEALMLKLTLQYLATWCEELTHWKRCWCWESLKAGEGDDRGWDGWIALPTQWTWVWVSSSSWWWTGKPSVLQSIGCKYWAWLNDWTDTELMWNLLGQGLNLCPLSSRQTPNHWTTREAQKSEFHIQRIVNSKACCSCGYYRNIHGASVPFPQVI